MQTAQPLLFPRSARTRVLLGQMLALHVEQSQNGSEWAHTVRTEALVGLHRDFDEKPTVPDLSDQVSTN